MRKITQQKSQLSSKNRKENMSKQMLKRNVKISDNDDAMQKKKKIFAC